MIRSVQVKADKTMGEIPVVLLIRSFDNESYLSHLGCGADRLKLRTESICKFRADIHMLIENRMALRERIKNFLSDAFGAYEAGNGKHRFVIYE